MTFEQAIEAIKEYMHVSLCVKGAAEQRALEAIEVLEMYAYKPKGGAIENHNYLIGQDAFID